MSSPESDFDEIDWAEETYQQAAQAVRKDRLGWVHFFWWAATVVFALSFSAIVFAVMNAQFLGFEVIVWAVFAFLGLGLGTLLLTIGVCLHLTNR